MTTVTKLMETSIPELFSRGLDEEKDLTIGSNHTDKIATVIFESVSNCLHDVKVKEYATAFLFEDLAGDLIACAVIQFHENQDKNEPGNWSYIWSFDREDIPDGSRTIKITDTQAQTYFASVAGSRYKMGFETAASLVETANYFLKVVNRYLEDNVTKDKEVAIELDGVFEARAAYDNGDLVKSIIPIGEIKAIAKGDGDIEVN